MASNRVESVSRFMLRSARQFIIDNKMIFELAIIAYAKCLPEPEPENTGWVNTPVLLRIKDKFLSFHKNDSKKALMESAWIAFIDEVEHDPYYTTLFQWMLEELVESVMSGEWKPRGQNDIPERLWAEPRPKGNYNGRKFKELIKAVRE